MSCLLSCCFAEKKESAVRQQQWCYEGRWLHSLWSSTAVVKSNALNPLYTLLLTSACQHHLLYSLLCATDLFLVINTWGVIFNGLSMSLTKLNLVKLSLKSQNIPISLDSLIITIYRYHMNNEQCKPSPLPPIIWVNKFVQSEVLAALFLISPLGCCSRAVHTLLQRYLWVCVRSRRCPLGIRTSCRLKWAGENTPPLSLCTDVFASFSWLHLLHSVIPHKVFMMSLFVLSLFVILTAKQHDYYLTLFKVCLCNHLFFKLL